MNSYQHKEIKKGFSLKFKPFFQVSSPLQSHYRMDNIKGVVRSNLPNSYRVKNLSVLSTSKIKRVPLLSAPSPLHPQNSSSTTLNPRKRISQKLQKNSPLPSSVELEKEFGPMQLPLVVFDLMRDRLISVSLTPGIRLLISILYAIL
jgi:hypothetical protein